LDPFNYFNYYTEIEEHFWRKRGAHLLVSPVDWAIVETWQKSGIPLEAVIKGIDRAFESWARSKRAAGGRQLKSLAYCVDAVLDAAEEAAESTAGAGPAADTPAKPAAEPFTRQEIQRFFERNAQRLATASEKQRPANPDLAARLAEFAARIAELRTILDPPAHLDLEDLERRLSILEEKLTATLTTHAPEDVLLDSRRELDRQLAPYRRKMTAAQLAQLEKQYTQKRLYESFGLPRLSLFYLT
jgi:hypothetical protein